jgi:CpXC protein
VSTFRSATIRCRCRRDYQVDVADGLHISLRPDIRQAIMDGVFHRFACPHCGTVTIVEDLLSYTDFPRRHWFTVVPRNGIAHRRAWLDIAHASFQQTMVERASPLAMEWAPEMTRRLIFGLASLREKLLLFDAGLDDHAIEAMKLELLPAIGLGFSPDEHFHVVRLDGEEIWFAHSHPQGGVFEMPVPRAMYRKVEGELGEMRATLPALFADIAVDYRVALIPEAPAQEASGGA